MKQIYSLLKIMSYRLIPVLKKNLNSSSKMDFFPIDSFESLLKLFHFKSLYKRKDKMKTFATNILQLKSKTKEKTNKNMNQIINYYYILNKKKNI